MQHSVPAQRSRLSASQPRHAAHPSHKSCLIHVVLILILMISPLGGAVNSALHQSQALALNTQQQLGNTPDYSITLHLFHEESTLTITVLPVLALAAMQEHREPVQLTGIDLPPELGRHGYNSIKADADVIPDRPAYSDAPWAVRHCDRPFSFIDLPAAKAAAAANEPLWHNKHGLQNRPIAHIAFSGLREQLEWSKTSTHDFLHQYAVDCGGLDCQVLIWHRPVLGDVVGPKGRQQQGIEFHGKIMCRNQRALLQLLVENTVQDGDLTQLPIWCQDSPGEPPFATVGRPYLKPCYERSKEELAESTFQQSSVI